MESCVYGMEQIFSHNPNPDLIHTKIIEDLKGHKFKIEDITLVKKINGLSCDVVAKDVRGYRSYRVALEKNTRFPHLYRVLDVSEQKLISKYQWER